MIGNLQGILGKIDAEYADLRYEVKHETEVSLAGQELREVSANDTDGFVLRVLDGGGFASVCFTREEEAEAGVASAVRNARLIGANRDSPNELAPVPVVKDTFRPELIEDPRDVPLSEKVDLVRRLNGHLLAPKAIATTNLAYREVIREKHFASTEGAEVSEELATSWIQGSVVASRGTETQNVRLEAGGGDGFQNVRDLEAEFEGRAKIAIELLDARPAMGRTYDCVLNPFLAGVFAHEAFGHFSEADCIEDLPAVREKMRIGARLGCEAISIVDDATRPGQIGHYRYDDEGVPVRRVDLLRNGVLTGRLHSRRTAAAFGEPVTGHAVAEDYEYAPIIRMGCIYIEPGEDSLEELLGRMGDGLYVVDPKGGETSGENFSFGAQWAFEVKDGKRGRLVRDLNISGNLYKTLDDIEAVGDDLWFSRTGGCGKGQLNVRSCLGGPHVLVRNLLVGGV